jgi:hypothetical protein
MAGIVGFGVVSDAIDGRLFVFDLSGAANRKNPFGMTQQLKATSWTHENDERFTEYYSRASQSAVTLQRIRSIRDSVLRVANRQASTKFMLDVADIGCGARTQSVSP